MLSSPQTVKLGVSSSLGAAEFIRLCILFDSNMHGAGDKLHSESLQGFISDYRECEVIGAPHALAVHICRVKADRSPASSDGMVP